MLAPRIPVQHCPICGASYPLTAKRCANCGAALTGIPSGRLRVKRRRVRRSLSLEAPPVDSWDEGDEDLHENGLPALSLRVLTITATLIVLVVGSGLLVARQVAGSVEPSMTTTVPVSKAVSARFSATPLPTNTKSLAPTVMPTLPLLATVTPAPPTPTITPTRGPCTQKAAKGDTVFGMAARCGHKDLSIVPTIVYLNGLRDANSLQEGEVLSIPWPTPTGGAPTDSSGANGPPAGGVVPTSTLPTGVEMYIVRKGDTAVGIAARYHITMKILRDLNPEIEFLQCDFGLPSGGATCTLRPILGEGQHIRVSAPTPTPSLSPTFSADQLLTPTGTATFNAPSSESPDDNMMYEAGDLPALRWNASGKLDSEQVYLVTVRDKTTGQTYLAATRDLSFQVPVSWQPADGTLHSFEWFVAVATKDQAGTPVPSALATETRTFTWHSR